MEAASVELQLKSKGFYCDLDEPRQDKVKEKASAIIVKALGDTPLRLCPQHVSNPLAMLGPLDMIYQSRENSPADFNNDSGVFYFNRR